MTFLFWLVRPKERIYGIFSLMLLNWTMHSMNLVMTSIPVSTRIWEALTMASLGWFVVSLIFFIHAQINYQNKRVETLLKLFALSGLGFFFLPSTEMVFLIGYKVWDSGLVVIGLYSLVILVKQYRKNPSSDLLLMKMAGLPILLCGLHDILLVNQLIDRSDGLIIQYSIMPVNLVFALFLIRRFVSSLTEAESLAQSLDLKVRKKQHDIEQQYEKLKQFEKQQTLSQERERIMRDMHDGIGGQLVSTLRLLDGEANPLANSVRQKIDDSLSDLRLVIDSLDPVLNDFPTLLGMMRHRLERLLNDAGMTLIWAVNDVPESSVLSPENNLHLMRIIQEVFSNAIKHSQASQVKLTTCAHPERPFNILISIEDNGVGLKGFNENKKSGRGSSNMEYRSTRIGAKVDILPQESGTTVCVELPGTPN